MMYEPIFIVIMDRIFVFIGEVLCIHDEQLMIHIDEPYDPNPGSSPILNKRFNHMIHQMIFI